MELDRTFLKKLWNGEKVLCLDEYNSQIPITELNTYLDK